MNWSARSVGDWFELSAIYRVATHAGALRMFLYADEPAKGSAPMSENWYRNFSVASLVSGSATTMQANALPSGTLRLPASPVRVETAFDAPQPLVAARTDATDCNRHSRRSLRELGIRAATFRADDPTAVSISADRDTGCVSMPVYGLQRGMSYELTMNTKVLRGDAPRVCLWEEPAGRCTTLQTVTQPKGASGRLVLRGRAGTNATTWRLFLYADAVRNGTTIAYSGIHLRLISDESLVLRPTTIATGSVPEITWHRSGTARYHVQVHDAQGPFVLALGDAFSRDWHVHGLPAGAKAVPIEIDGYRNGWAIDARGDMKLTVEYTPARVGHAAMRVSELALLALLGSVAIPRLRRFRRRRVDERVRRSHREGPRRVQVPDAWLLPADRGASDPRGHKPVITL